MIRTRALLAGLAVAAMSATASASPTKQECLAANDKAQDLRNAGKLKDAREQLAVCISQSCPGPVRDDCTQRLTEIATAQPSVVFAVKDGGGNDLSAVSVTVDGQPLVGRLDGSAIDVDPGDHVFRFESGGAVANKHFVVREGEKGRREAIVVRATPAPAGPVPSEQSGSTQRTAGLVVGGVGVAGVVIGSIFGALALSAKPTGCPPNNTEACPRTAQNQSSVNKLPGLEDGSDVGLGIGIAGLVVGSILFFTAPHGGEARGGAASLKPWIGLGSTGVGGTF
jgi:hypothetical protein